jgi:hypothetical protein
MDFPSGPWTGFYNYGRSPRKNRMDLVLIFADHTVSGDGSDEIGQFVLAGRFDGTNGECYWTKTCIGAHEVYYRGFREAKGFGGYANCLTSQAVFTSGHLDSAKANRIMRARKSPRQWKQLGWKPEYEFPLASGRRE